MKIFDSPFSRKGIRVLTIFLTIPVTLSFMIIGYRTKDVDPVTFSNMISSVFTILISLIMAILAIFVLLITLSPKYSLPKEYSELLTECGYKGEVGDVLEIIDFLETELKKTRAMLNDCPEDCSMVSDDCKIEQKVELLEKIISKFHENKDRYKFRTRSARSVITSATVFMLAFCGLLLSYNPLLSNIFVFVNVSAIFAIVFGWACCYVLELARYLYTG